MDNFKKIASAEELENLRALLLQERENNIPKDTTEKILVDFTKPCGKIKPVCSCFCKSDMFVPDAQVFDIFTDCVFPNFDKDEKNEEGYDFSSFDKLISSLYRGDKTLIVRLCDTDRGKMENSSKALPKDFNKWARICEKIIAHYSSGEFSGFNYNIQYWQIMNCPDASDSFSCKDFFELYKISAIHLKECFPDIKIGCASFGSSVNDYIHEFLNYLCLDKRVSFNFFSWKCCTDKVEKLLNYTYVARTLLDKYGFLETQSILTEWCYKKADTGSINKKFSPEKNAAFSAGVLLSLQKAPLDFAVSYEESECCCDTKKQLVFKAFSTLSSLGIEVVSDTAADHIYILGAKNDDKGAFMVANFNPYEQLSHELSFDLKGVFGKKCEISLIDENHNLEVVYSGMVPDSYTLSPDSAILVKLI